MTTDSLGNIYVVGYTKGSLDNNIRKGTGNDKDIFIIKYDENGNKLWSLQEGTDSEDIAYGVATDSLDNIMEVENQILDFLDTYLEYFYHNQYFYRN